MSLSPSFLSPAHGGTGSGDQGTMVMAGPVAPVSTGAIGEFRGGLSDAMSGRVSLLMLDTVVLGLLVFYYWTRHAQGGG